MKFFLIIIASFLIFGCGHDSDSDRPNEIILKLLYESDSKDSKYRYVTYSQDFSEKTKKYVRESSGHFSYQLSLESEKNSGEVRRIFTNNIQNFSFLPSENKLFFYNPLLLDQGDLSYSATIDYNFFKEMENIDYIDYKNFDKEIASFSSFEDWNFPWNNSASKISIEFRYPLVEKEASLARNVIIKFKVKN